MTWLIETELKHAEYVVGGLFSGRVPRGFTSRICAHAVVQAILALDGVAFA